MLQQAVSLKTISSNEIQRIASVAEIELSPADVTQRFGPARETIVIDDQNNNTLERWYYELPWGNKIALEIASDSSTLKIYTEVLEIQAILEYLNLLGCRHRIDEDGIAEMKQHAPTCTQGLGRFHLLRLDDNDNTFRMQTYESQRVANYYQKLFEDRGHKQVYWVVSDGDEVAAD